MRWNVRRRHGFRYRHQRGSLTTLCSFNGSNGMFPASGLLLIGSTLYGTTLCGGAYNNNGTVFSIATSRGNPTTLCSFRL